MSLPALLAEHHSTTTDARLMPRRYTLDKMSGRIVLKPLDNSATGRKRSISMGTSKPNYPPCRTTSTTGRSNPLFNRAPVVKSCDQGVPASRQTLLQLSSARSSTKRKLSLSAILNDGRFEPLAKRHHADRPTAIATDIVGKSCANYETITVYQRSLAGSAGGSSSKTLSGATERVEHAAVRGQARQSGHIRVSGPVDPACQTHAREGVPPQWRFPAMMSHADCSIIFGVVQSPTFMIGLPCGGMIEVANIYEQ